MKLQEPHLDSVAGENLLSVPPLQGTLPLTLGDATSPSRVFLHNQGSLLSHVPGSQFSAQQGPPSSPPAPASSARGSSNSALPSPATLQGHQRPQHCLQCLYPSHPPGDPPGCSWEQTTPCSPSKVWSPVLAACTPQWTSTESLFANVFWGPASCNLLDPALGPWVNLANPHCSEELQPPPSWLQLPSSGKGPLKTVPSPLETAAIRPKSPPVSFLGRYSISGAGGPHPQYL